MDALKFSALKELNVWMYQHLESVQCVDLALLATLETHSSVMVYSYYYTDIAMVLHVVLYNINNTIPDIDECAQNATLCGQLCVNTDGSYFCSCEDGYELVEGTNQCRGEEINIIIKNVMQGIFGMSKC